MKRIMLAAVLAGLAAPAISCDVTAGAGKVFRAAEGETGGFATAACVFRHKYEVRAFYYGEQRIYNDSVRIEPFWAATVQRLWVFREGRRIQPIFGMGVLLKESQRCHFDGDLNCNRMLPMAYGFYFTAGLKVGDISFTASHASNNSMDWGPEKKNLGLDSLRMDVWLR